LEIRIIFATEFAHKVGFFKEGNGRGIFKRKPKGIKGPSPQGKVLTPRN